MSYDHEAEMERYRKVWAEEAEERSRVQEALTKVLIASPSEGIPMVIEAIRDAAQHFDCCCDPHTEAELDEIADRMEGK